ncbi:hypothetical protein BH20ACT5_BH20ACT5_19270 [soil metagenome]
MLLAVAAAVRDSHSVRADYEKHDGTSTRRTLEPHRIVHAGRRWYVVAWDVERADWRTFRLDRLRPRTPTGPRFTPREAPAADLAAYTSRGISTDVYRYRARVTVHAPAYVVAEQIGPTVGIVTALDETSCELVAGANSLDAMALHLGVLGYDFVVHEPVELRDHLAALAARLIRADASGRRLTSYPP